ncbi:winged helix-turn-helix transcriptional regulator [Streptomyces sp. NPDC057617]|uniref:winged helix-turn-helix transcriptional regulator n=1 Tax=Streptomyces sp. NPDC057617 TaxID=3346184 RepID=UPI0036ABAA92
MTNASQPGTSLTGSVDAQGVEDALTLIAPRWTAWTLQTLAQHGSPMHVSDIAAQLPFVHQNVIGKRLHEMRGDGLVTRTDTRYRAPYQLSVLGQALEPVHRALSDWSQAHIPLGAAADAERAEDAVRRLYLRHTTAVIQVLDTAGPTRFVHIAEMAGLDTTLAFHRLNRLQTDGLVTRTGPRRGDPYTLTDAGRALGPVYAAVEQWSHPTAPAPTSAAPATRVTRTHTGARTESQDIRAAAALRRTTASPGGLFSHASQPQPQVRAAVTAQPAPRRGR